MAALTGASSSAAIAASPARQDGLESPGLAASRSAIEALLGRLVPEVPFPSVAMTIAELSALQTALGNKRAALTAELSQLRIVEAWLGRHLDQAIRRDLAATIGGDARDGFAGQTEHSQEVRSAALTQRRRRSRLKLICERVDMFLQGW